MLSHGFLISAVLSGWLISTCVKSAAEPLSSPKRSETNLRTFAARGVVEEIQADGRTVVLGHESITNYMEAMTMPFKAKEPKELTGLRPGDQVSFRLSVTDTESWIDQVAKITAATPRSPASPPLEARAGERRPSKPTHHPLLDYKFTNELGQQVSLRDFRGQGLAITFFFARCPIPDYCPRLSRNFQEASIRLGRIAAGPTNWHFLSVSFDTEFDSPRVLKAYGEMYHYDPAHWSFLTGSAESVGELARLSDVKFERDGGSINHNFRTLIIDAAGHLQMVFPTGGDLSGAIVDEILKAASVTNRSPAQASVSELLPPECVVAKGPVR